MTGVNVGVRSQPGSGSFGRARISLLLAGRLGDQTTPQRQGESVAVIVGPISNLRM